MKSFKTTLAAILMGCVATPALATEVQDTLVIEDVNKVKIETQDTVQRIVISGAKDDPDFHYVQRISIPDTNAVRRSIRSVRDFNRITVNKNGKNAKWDASFHINLGLNTMLDAPDNYDFKVWPSFEFGLGVSHNWHPFGKMNEWSIGYGINWRYFRLGDDSYLGKDANRYMVPTPYNPGETETNSSINVFCLQVPIIYTHYFDKKRDWSVSLGAIVNWNVSGSSNRSYTFNDEDYDVSYNSLGQMPFTFDGIVKIGTPWLPTIYCKYSPSNFFRNSRGPKMHTLSFGFCL